MLGGCLLDVRYIIWCLIVCCFVIFFCISLQFERQGETLSGETIAIGSNETLDILLTNSLTVISVLYFEIPSPVDDSVNSRHSVGE